MKLVAAYVTRNEADRWFEHSLASVGKIVDHIHVFDDQSDDETVDVARTFADVVTVRPDQCPSFEEDEGRFRATAWADMGETLKLDKGDVVLAIDADEIVSISAHTDGRSAVLWNLSNAPKADAFRVKIHESFGVDDDGTPLVRTDGWWGDISGVRLAKWRQGSFKGGGGSGSVPHCPTIEPAVAFSIVHLGYALEADRIKKYQWYSSRNSFGHNPAHIASIVQTPTLHRLEGIHV